VCPIHTASCSDALRNARELELRVNNILLLIFHMEIRQLLMQTTRGKKEIKRKNNRMEARKQRGVIIIEWKKDIKVD
jgi:hypothetical protein